MLIEFLLLLIGSIGFSLCYKFYKEGQKERKNFINSLIPGSKWKLQKEPASNPFSKFPPNIIIIIIETRKNYYGDIWIQYQFEDCKIIREKPIADFKKLYKKLN